MSTHASAATLLAALQATGGTGLTVQGYALESLNAWAHLPKGVQL